MNIHGLSTSNPNRGSGGSSGPPGCLDQLKSYYSTLPLFNKYLMNFCTFLYLISWMTSYVNYYMILVPGFLAKFQSKYFKLSG